MHESDVKQKFELEDLKGSIHFRDLGVAGSHC